MTHWTPTVDGVAVPSVTTILGVMEKEWLRPWYAKEELSRCVGELDATVKSLLPFKDLLASWRKRIKEKDYAATQRAKDAGDIGTMFHQCVEDILRNESKLVIPPPVLPLVRKWQEWQDQFNPQPHGLEQHVISKKWMYGGTFDFIGITSHTNEPGELTIADWKTSNKIDDTFGLQLAAYAYAYGEQKGWTEEETWKWITVGVSVRVDKRAYKDNELEVKVYNDLPYLFRVFSSLREPYDYLRKVGVWESEDE